MKIVIVGGVAGGATAAARLRRLNEKDEIILLEKDEHIAFANCGLPYYIGNEIKDRHQLLVKTPEQVKKLYNIDVRIKNEVIEVEDSSKTIVIKNHLTNETYTETFDKLILSPGANPIKLNFTNDNRVMTLRNINDTDKIYNFLENNIVKHITVIGGGFIGLEMAENLTKRGYAVTLVEQAKHLLKTLDLDMSKKLHETLVNNVINLQCDTKIIDIDEQKVITDKETFNTDLIISAIGVRPTTSFLKSSNINLEQNGSIIVDDNFETSIKDIYAVGDAIQVVNHITNEKMNIPLAWSANRQARLVADYINNIQFDNFKVNGTAIVKVFDLTIATTGLNEEFLETTNTNFKSITVIRSNHASYYPNSSMLTIKVTYDINTRKILGGQIIGQDGVDKRIDLLSMAISNNYTVDMLSSIEVSYAPPYNSAKDPLNIVGYSAQNNMKTTNKIEEDAYLIDVRTNVEYNNGYINNAININVDELRDNLPNIDKDQKITVYCQVGQRGYIAQRILEANGYTNVYNLNGGYHMYK